MEAVPEQVAHVESQQVWLGASRTSGPVQVLQVVLVVPEQVAHSALQATQFVPLKTKAPVHVEH